MRIKILAVWCLMTLSSGLHGQGRERVLIAAAADLKFAMDSVVAAYKDSVAGAIEVVYGSSGKLYEQIVNGAPFDIYFSADRQYPLRLKAKGRVISDVTTYGYGRIVVWFPAAGRRVEKLESLTAPEFRKIAIANPLHAPYGKSAEESLRHYGLYEQIRKKLVFGENVSQAAQFVTSGAADAGIIALSLAVSPALRKLKGNYYIIPPESYSPMEQAYAVLDKARGKKQVVDFVAFLQTTQAQAILSYFGFSNQR